MICEHIVFDCDGVLVDSEPLSMAVDRELLAEHGIHFGFEETGRRFIGKSMAALIEEIERDYPVTLRRDFSEEKDRRLLARYHTELSSIAGVAEALDAISLRKSIASNSPRERINFALNKTGLGAHFGGRISGVEDVANPKPAPDVYLHAAAQAGVAPRRCLVVEDSVTGVMSAAAAGCRVFGFTGSAHNPAEQAMALSAAGAILTFATMEDLPALVAKFAQF